MKKIILYLVIPFLLLSYEASAQALRIDGVVSDKDGPLPGVSVVEKENPANGTITNQSGKFTLSLKGQSKIIVISSIGYVSQELKAAGPIVNITLVAEARSLSEVVVIGYGTQKRKDLTGAVGQVNMSDFQKAPVKSFDDALAGRLAGVQVSGNDGQPGSLNNIVIRGGNSVTQDNSPLYVIDGFPIENPDYNVINPDDIESIDVLKDASATAIYGARGANGVIIITTKKGVNGAPVVSYNGYYGIQKIRKTMDLMGPYDFVKYQMELNPTEAAKSYFANGQTLDSYKNVPGIDFQDYIFRTAPMQSHNIALRGGNKTTKYSVSGNIFRQDGVIINSGFARNQGRITLDQAIGNKVNISTNINLNNSVSSGNLVSAPLDQGATANTLYSVWAYRPVSGNNEDLLDDFTDPGFDSATYSDYRVNPVIDAQNVLRRAINNNLIANGYINYKITPNLSVRVLGGITTGVIRDESFYTSQTAVGSRLGASGALYNTYNTNWVNENTLTYKKAWHANHNIEVLAGYTMQGNTYKRNGFSATNLIKESLGLDGLDNSRSIIPASATSQWGLTSFLGRINYSYKSKYLFTASMRADGSSKFIGNNRWGYFPSGSVAWRLSSEQFLKKIRIINDAKLRFSYGATGNNRISDFPYLSTVLTNSAYYSFNNQVPSPGLSVSQFGNPDLRWETTYQSNLGLDLSLFNSRIEVTADVYRKKTKDLLLNADVPYTTGIATVLKNVGDMQNEGLEFTLNTVNIKTDKFSWSTNFNISFNRNKVLALADNQNTLTQSVALRSGYNNLFPYIAEVGAPVTQFYGLIWDGVYQYTDFDKLPDGRYVLKNNVTTNGKVRSAIQPGDIKYKDINGDLVVDAKDYTAIGRALPIHTGGFANNFTYANFDLNIFFQWSYGNSILNANRIFLEGNETGSPYVNQYATYLNRWTDANQSNTYYRTGGQGPAAYSSRLLEDGSFLRLKTVSLGYNVPNQYLKKYNLKSLRIYTSCQNLITWTSYSGMDPEVSVRNSILTPGFDFSAYPRARVLTFGLSASFQ